MRLCVVVALLWSSFAFAGGSKVPLRAVKVLPDTRQVLLFDKTRGTHVLAEVGETVEGFKVEDVDDDEVTLTSESGTEVILAAPISRPQATAKAEPEPQDPYAEPAAATAPVAATAAAPDTATAAALGAALASDPSSITLSHADVSAAIGNFAQLTAAIRGAFTPAGARIDAVAEGSLFAKAGLRAGDVITQVDRTPLRSLDDAASLYARAATARNVSVQLVRAGKPLTLRIAIQ